MNTFPVTASTLSEKELGNFIVKRYNLSPNSSCKLFRTGINHTYFITDKHIKYAARVYCYNWRSRTEIEEEIKLLTELKNHISVSCPLADNNGNFIQEIQAPEGTRYMVLFSFAEGKKMRFMDQDTCFKIGSIMGKMHTVTAHKKLNRTHYNSEILLEQSFANLKTFFSENLAVMKLFQQMAGVISKSFKKTKLERNEKGIIHLDIWYDNFSVVDAENITLFDFDNCGNGAFIWDIGYFCKQLFCIEVDKNAYEQKYTSFLTGYQTQRIVSASELSLLPEAGAAIFLHYLGVQAQRFDWSNIFLSENYLKMYVGRIKAWLDYYNEKTIVYP